MKKGILLFLSFMMIELIEAQPSINSYPAMFNKVVFIENSETINPLNLQIEIRLNQKILDTSLSKYKTVPFAWKTVHPIHADTIYIQNNYATHSFLIRKNDGEARIYLGGIALNNRNTSTAIILDKNSPVSRIFHENISDGEKFSNEFVLIINEVEIVDWNKLKVYDPNIHDQNISNIPPLLPSEKTILSKNLDETNAQNTQPEPDSIINVIFRNSENQIIQNVELKLILNNDSCIHLKQIASTAQTDYKTFLIPPIYRNQSTISNRIIAEHQKYETDTLSLNIGSNQYYLFQPKEPWIALGIKTPFKKPYSEFILQLDETNKAFIDSLKQTSILTIDSIIPFNPLNGETFQFAYISFTNLTQKEEKQRIIKAIRAMNIQIRPLMILHSELFIHTVGIGNSIIVHYEYSQNPNLVLDKLEEAGLTDAIVLRTTSGELYRLASANIPEYWDLEQIRHTLNELFKLEMFYYVNVEIDYRNN